MNSDREWSASFASASTNAMGFYDDIMVPRMFEPWAQFLLDQLDRSSGQRLLDVACGPGTVTRLAAARVGPTGSVTGCDLSPAMLDLARSKSPDAGSAPIEYLQCPADSLSVDDHSFDTVTCQQGLQFFPDRPAALAEMRRALRPGGQVGIAVWADIQKCPPFDALGHALRQVLGDDIATSYEGGPWGFGDAATLAQLVSNSGFEDVDVRTHEIPLVFEGGPDQLLLTLHAASVATTLAELSDSDTAALRAAVEEAARPITTDAMVRSFATSNIVTARV